MAVKKILIAEDEKPMARALTLKLEHSGFEVTHAENGAVAMDFMEKNPYNLLLLDLVMPKMDGFTVLKTMKEKGIKVPVIILSNLGQKEDEDHARTFGARAFFIKSNTPIATIVDKVTEFLQ